MEISLVTNNFSMIPKNKIQTTHNMKPTQKDFELLAMAIQSAYESRINPDEIGSDLFSHHTYTTQETLEDKISIADMLMSIAVNYHTQIMLNIESNISKTIVSKYNCYFSHDDEKYILIFPLIRLISSGYAIIIRL